MGLGISKEKKNEMKKALGIVEKTYNEEPVWLNIEEKNIREKPTEEVSCKICRVNFSSRANLDRHIRTSAIHQMNLNSKKTHDEKPVLNIEEKNIREKPTGEVSCEICGISFFSQYNLDRHIKGSVVHQMNLNSRKIDSTNCEPFKPKVEITETAYTARSIIGEIRKHIYEVDSCSMSAYRLRAEVDVYLENKFPGNPFYTSTGTLGANDGWDISSKTIPWLILWHRQKDCRSTNVYLEPHNKRILFGVREDESYYRYRR